MCYVTTFMSGKGGSGKTTLSLTMAYMLSSCNLNVLLVDCDLSTNGATFFYEDLLNENLENSSSFLSVLNGDTYPQTVVKVKNNYSFLPSIKNIISEMKDYYVEDGKVWENSVSEFLQNMRKEYDIILLDCQAGYRNMLSYLLKESDAALVVAEADPISSSALRNLSYKISDKIGKKHIYQTFNKVTDEEYEVYKKLTDETVFKNIEPIKFDFNIKKAISLSQVPSLENVGVEYSMLILKICKILFSKYDDEWRLQQQDIRIKKDLLKEREKTLRDKRSKQRNRLFNPKYSYLFTVVAMLSCIVGILITFTNVNGMIVENNILSYILLVVVVFMIGVLLWSIFIYLGDLKKLDRQLQNVRYLIADIEQKEERYSSSRIKE